jgi:hypothetical protein
MFYALEFRDTELHDVVWHCDQGEYLESADYSNVRFINMLEY